MIPTTRPLLRAAALGCFLVLALFAAGGSTGAETPQPPTLQQAATYYALGALDAAEAEVRRFVATYPNDPRLAEAIKLLAEIRIERERAHAATTGSAATGAVVNVQPDRAADGSTPRLVDPRLLSSPPSQVLLRWDRAFPGAPAQYRKDGVFAVTAEGGASKTTIRIHTSGGTGEMAQQRTGSMLVIDIPGLADALPQGGLDLPQGPASRVRHSQLSTEPLVARLVIDLKNPQVRAVVTSGDEEITIELEDLSAPAEGAPQGGLFRAPVAGVRHVIEVLSGTHQRGFVAEDLTEPVAVRVVDPVLLAPMGGVTVEFRAVDAGVKIATPRVTTTPDGVASTRVRLDEVAGRKVVTASVVGTPAEVSFELYALARPPDSIRKVAADDVKVRTRQTSTTPLSVIVQDQYGNPVPGVEVTWSYVQGAGSVDADPERAGEQAVSETDRDGKATLRQWATGPRAGLQRIQAAFTTGGVTRFTQFEVDVLPQLVSMDFYQTPVPDILRFLGRIANWNLVLSDGVGQLPDPNTTVHLENIPIDEALDKILAMKNLTRLEEADGAIRILTFTEAQTRGQAVILDPALLPDLPQNVVRTVVIPVRRRNMEQMVTLIRDVTTPEAKIFSDPATGQVILTDFVVNVRRAVDLVQQLERGLEARVLRVSHVDAKALEDFLKNFLSAEERLVPKSGGFLFVGSPASAAQLERLIAEVDRPENTELLAASEAAVAVTRVFQVEFTQAKILEPILGQLFSQTELRVTAPTAAGAAASATSGSGEQRAASGSAAQQVVQKILVVADERTNKLIVTAPEVLIPGISATIRELDTVVIAARPLVVEVAGVDITLVNTMVTGLYPGLRIFPDAASNRLILFVPPAFDSVPLRELFASLTQAGTGEVVKVHVHYLEHLPEVKALEVMTTIFGPQAAGSGEASVSIVRPGGAGRSLPVRFMALGREGRQGVILIGTEERIARAVTVLRQVDTAPASLGNVVVIRKLQFADVAKLASVLEELKTEAARAANVPARGRTTRTTRTTTDEMEEPGSSADPDRPEEGSAGASSATATVPGLGSVASTRMSDLRMVKDERTNTLILIGPPDIVSSINRLIDTLDTRVGFWEVIALRATDVVEIEPVLKAIFPTSQFEPEKSSNSLFVVVNTQEELRDIRRAIGYLDQTPGNRVGETTVTIQLRYASAAEVSQTLLQMFAPQVSNAAPSLSSLGTGGNEAIMQAYLDYLREENRRQARIGGFRVFPVSGKNTLIITSSIDVARKAVAVVREIDQTDSQGRPTLTLNLRTLDPVLATTALREEFSDVTFFPVPGSKFLLLRGIRSRLDMVAREIAAMDLDGIEFDSYVFSAIATPLITGEASGVNISRDIPPMLPGGRAVFSTSPAAGNFVLMWGYRGDLNRALDYCRRIDEACRQNIGGETRVRFVEVRNRPAAEVFAELGNYWAISQNLRLLTQPESPRNGILIFLPPNHLQQVQSTIAMLDTFIPTRIVKPQTQTVSNLQTMLVALYPDVRVQVLSGVVGSEYLVLQGSTARVNAALQTIRAVDSDTSSREFRMYPLSTVASATTLVNLRLLFPNVNLMSFEDNQSIIAQAARPVLDEIGEAIRALDSRDVKLVEIMNADDDGLAEILRTAFPGLFVDYQHQGPVHTYMVLRAPNPRVLAEVMEFIRIMDNVNVNMVRLNHVTPVSMQALIATVYQDLSAGVSIIERLNAITFVATPEKAKLVRDFIARFDVPLSTRILSSQRLPLAEAQTVLEAYLPSVRTQLVTNPSRIIAQGSPENLEAAARLIADIDAGMEWKVLPLGRVTGANAVTMVTDLFPSVRASQMPAGNGLVLVGLPANVTEASRLLQQIDARDLNIIPVRQAEIATVFTAVDEFFPDVQVQNLTSISALAVSGDAATVHQIQKFVASIDRKLHTAIRPLRFLDPSAISALNGTKEIEELQTTLRAYLTPGEGRLYFDNQANAFVITDNLERVDGVLRVLDDLDKAPPQIMIEAVFADVNITNRQSIGLTWEARPDLAALGFRPEVAFTDAERTTRIGNSGGSSGAYSSGGFTFGVARNTLMATVNAVLSNEDFRVLLSPKVTTRNNQEAQINLGTEVLTTPTSSSAAGSASPTTSRAPVGMRVTPSMASGSENIRLRLEITNQSISTEVSGNFSVNTTSQRDISTTVDVPDGSTLVLGGLIRQEKTDNQSKLPVLGDIPGIGQLFRNTNQIDVTRELLVFITPRVIYPQTRDLQMEEELNRFKYLVNFPADWSGRRWLVNNPQRGAAIRSQIPQGIRILTVADTVSRPSASAPVPAASPVAYAPAPVASTPTPAPYVPPASAVPAPPTAAPAPQTLPSGPLGSTSTVDVNSATAAELRSVPDMPAHVAELIVKFREANGAYRSLPDLLRVPGMTPALLDKTAKYLRITSTATPVAPVPPAAYTPPSAYQPTPAPSYSPSTAAAPATKINLNTASVEELRTLPGLQDNHARMIVAYRNTYGSFSTTDQLIDVPGISPQMYGRIREYVTVGAGSSSRASAPTSAPVSAPSAAVLNINTANEAELVGVGFSTQQARLIISYRNSYGSFGNVDELVDVPTVTPELVAQLRARLSTSGGTSLAPPTGAVPTPVYGSAATASGPVVDLNAATEADLMAIPGFTVQNVKLIISYRTTYGSFTSVDELLEVPSITPEILAQVRGRLVVR